MTKKIKGFIEIDGSYINVAHIISVSPSREIERVTHIFTTFDVAVEGSYGTETNAYVDEVMALIAEAQV